MQSPLSDETLREIRSRGLSVLQNHRGDYLVLKPFRTEGNAIPGRQAWFRNEAGEQEFSDAPAVEVRPADNEWEMRVREWVRGPGPGDFERRITSEQSLVSELETYFFAPNPEFSAALEARQRRSQQG